MMWLPVAGIASLAWFPFLMVRLHPSAVRINLPIFVLLAVFLGWNLMGRIERNYFGSCSTDGSRAYTWMLEE